MSAIKDKYKDLLDSHHIAWEEGHHTEELILNADEVIKSPGIPNDAPLILKLKAQGTPVISEIEFAGRYFLIFIQAPSLRFPEMRIFSN